MNFIRKLSTMPALCLTPPSHPNIQTLDKSLFVVKAKVWALLLTDLKSIGKFMGNKKSRGVSLKIPSYPAIIEFPQLELSSDETAALKVKNNKFKALLIDPEFTSSISEPFKFNDNVPNDIIEQLNGILHFIKPFEITFDYNYWTHEQILKSVLPQELHGNCPTSFTLAGHLAHLNLKSEYMPYKNIIGEVILSKFPNIRTVVNKTNNIISEFRTFEMEILAGEDDFIVTQKESGCKFTFDFSKVYWNSRLATEHERLINSFQPNEAICDVMAGVGPFAVPAGKREVLVFANDLNPESYKYLKQNIKNNKVEKYVQPFNVDGVDFIKDSPKILRDFIEKTPINSVSKGNNNTKKQKIAIQQPTFFSQYIMNLPDSAITFVPHYVSLFSRAFPDLSKDQIKAMKGFKLPIINVHHFEKYKEEEITGDISKELERRMRDKIAGYLDFDIDINSMNFHVVRQVAPCKPMYCISFTLPEKVAFRPI